MAHVGERIAPPPPSSSLADVDPTRSNPVTAGTHDFNVWSWCETAAVQIKRGVSLRYEDESAEKDFLKCANQRNAARLKIPAMLALLFLLALILISILALFTDLFRDHPMLDQAKHVFGHPLRHQALMITFVGFSGQVAGGGMILLMHLLQERLPIFVDSGIMAILLFEQLSTFITHRHRSCTITGQPADCLQLDTDAPLCDTTVLLRLVTILVVGFFVFEFRSSRSWMLCLSSVALYGAFTLHSKLSPEGTFHSVFNAAFYTVICLMSWLGRYHTEKTQREAQNRERQVKVMGTMMQKMLDLCIHSSARVGTDGQLEDLVWGLLRAYGVLFLGGVVGVHGGVSGGWVHP